MQKHIRVLTITPALINTCSRTHTAQEQCYTEGTVRLEGLFSSSAGRVEFCKDGVWGTVCGDSAFTGWSEKNGQVVCRDLGFSGVLNSILPGDR